MGAVASSRTSYYCVGWDDPDWPWNQGQEYRWWEEIFQNGKTHMGQIHGDNKYNYAMDFNTLYDGDYGPDLDYASRKNMFTDRLRHGCYHCYLKNYTSMDYTEEEQLKIPEPEN